MISLEDDPLLGRFFNTSQKKATWIARLKLVYIFWILFVLLGFFFYIIWYLMI